MRRSRRCLAAAAAWLACAAPIAAQHHPEHPTDPDAPVGARPRERHRLSDPEGALMGYYGALLAFTPLGAAPPSRSSRGLDLTVALELSLLPPLSPAQRSQTFAKAEHTNLSPVLPRPRFAVALPAGVVVEGSWVPPLEMFGAKANLYGLALSRRLEARGLTVTPRAVVSGGTITASITCSEDLGTSNDGDQLFYEHVCHGLPSRDKFTVQAAGADLTVARPFRSPSLSRWTPYAGVGIRSERSTFDVGVLLEDGDIDADHPILEMRATRAYGLAGARWRAADRLSAAGELFYAPGSVVTGRVLVALGIGRRLAK